VAAFSPASQIRARVWTFADEPIDAAFFARRVRAAVDARGGMLDARHDACRLVHAESDGLPGVVADRYADTLVVQLSSAGAEAWRDAIVDALVDATGATTGGRALGRRGAPARGARAAHRRAARPRRRAGRDARGRDRVPRRRRARPEDRLLPRPARQPAPRARARARPARAQRVLLHRRIRAGRARRRRARGRLDRQLDRRARAGARQPRRESVAAGRPRAHGSRRTSSRTCGALRNENRHYDLAILDPPKFAPTAAHAQRAARAYKDINLLALKLLAPGGLLATFSCSGGVSADLFQKIVAGAAVDAKVDATIVGRFAASADHPIALAFPRANTSRVSQSARLSATSKNEAATAARRRLRRLGRADRRSPGARCVQRHAADRHELMNVLRSSPFIGRPSCCTPSSSPAASSSARRPTGKSS
jgi:23S rRNA (cytosine1962-C5)-methyltransferase